MNAESSTRHWIATRLLRKVAVPDRKYLQHVRTFAATCWCEGTPIHYLMSNECVTPLRGLELIYKWVKSWWYSWTSLVKLAYESCTNSLDFRCPLEILFNCILSYRCTPHGLLELRKSIIQVLSGRGRSNLRQTEENHMADDLNFIRIVRKARNDPTDKLVEVELGQTGI